jgi:alpha-beta hydrolase superfamily lysophospholipase
MATLQSKDGTKLYYEVHRAENQRAVALLVHGFAEHCQRYHGMIEWLNQLNITVYCFDYRGHGRSEGRRGFIERFDDYVDDIQAVRAVIESEQSDKYFILSHSNGGLISLHSIAQNAQRVKGSVFSSPFFGFELKVPFYKAFLGKGLSKLMPTLELPTGLDASTVSHDPKVVSEYGTDPLMIKIATARWFTETLQAHTRCEALVKSLTIPVLFQLAGDDKIASTPESKRLFEHIGSEDQSLEVYDGLYHEVWFELDKKKVFDDLKRWLESHI